MGMADPPMKKKSKERGKERGQSGSQREGAIFDRDQGRNHGQGTARNWFKAESYNICKMHRTERFTKLPKRARACDRGEAIAAHLMTTGIARSSAVGYCLVFTLDTATGSR